MSTASLKTLTQYLEKTRAARGPQESGIQPRPAGSITEGSEEQKQIWLHSELAGAAQIYNEPVTLHFRGELSRAALEQAFEYFLNRHEAWRTVFEWRDGKLLQIVKPARAVDLTVLDLRDLPAEEREALAIDLAKRDFRLPFDLAKGPLFRTRLIRLADGDFRLFLSLHHIIFDGVSMAQILLPEIQSAYQTFLHGIPPSLPAPAFQYPDYAYWQAKQLAGGDAERYLPYWERQLATDLPEPQLPTDHPRPLVRSYAGGTEMFQIAPSTAAKVKEFGNGEGVTPFMTLLAAFHMLLFHETGQVDQGIGTVMSTRQQPGSERVLGYFLNTVILRTRFAPEDTLASLIAGVRETVLGAMSHEVPYRLVASRCGRTRSRSSSSAAQAMFIFEPPIAKAAFSVERGAQWDLTQNDVQTGLSKFDLCLWIDERDGFLGRFNYSTDLFENPTIVRMKKAWASLLQLIADDPHRTVAEFSHALTAQAAKAKVLPFSKRFSLISSVRFGRS